LPRGDVNRLLLVAVEALASRAKRENGHAEYG
jgi:hypothetical protein